MIAPTRRAILVAAAAFPVAVLPALAGARLWGAWAVAAVAFAALLAIDAAVALRPRELEVDVDAPAALAVGEAGSLRLRLASRRRAAAVEVLAELHEHLDPQPPATVRVAPGAPGALEVPLLARRRGLLSVDELWCRWTGPLGLAAFTARRSVGRTVAVSPNLRPVRAAAFRYFGSRELAAGVQVERFLGDGSEFDALREWAPGLDPRAISWKASARHRKLVAQEFRAERNHQVVLALDTGHLMSEPLDGIPRLDHAVGSALLLAYVSLRLGDRVAMFGFDRSARVWVEPQGGLGAFPRLQQASAQLAYAPDETNFTVGLAELSTRLRRRSLVVVFTEFVDSVTAELMVENLTRLARRQLVVFVALRDPTIDAIASARPRRLDDVHRAVVASDFVRERERVLARLRRVGVLCVDASPSAVSTHLVNRYLDVKRRELIA